MSRKRKTRDKIYRPGWTTASVKLKTQPWRVAAVFDPLYAMIDQLEQHGTIDVVGGGQAVFKYMDGSWYDTHNAILGFIEAYEIHEARTGISLALEPLRQFANKLKYQMPVFQADTDAVRACLARCKAATNEMTAGYAQELLNDFAIKEELQKKAAHGN